MKYITLVLCLISTSSFAEVRCNKGGLWFLPDGTVDCKACPSEPDLVSNNSANIPLGCKAPIAGVIVRVNQYTEMERHKAFAEQLSEYQQSITSMQNSLGALQDNLGTAKAELDLNKKVSRQFALQVIQLTAERDKGKKHSDTLFWITVGLSSMVLGLMGVCFYELKKAD